MNTELSHLKRLERVHIKRPVYFVTCCAFDRRPVLTLPGVPEILREEWNNAWKLHGWRIGRFVIMPDHVHFFCCEAPTVAGVGDPGSEQGPASARPATGRVKTLSCFVGAWKQWTAKRMTRELGLHAPIWQPEFFDHILRSDESYSEKWSYVRDNPVRAGFVETADRWPHQGSIHFDVPYGC